MTADEMAQALAALVEADAGQMAAEVTGDDDAPGLESVNSYADAGVLTSEAGLVVALTDGSEFQVTVVRSR